MYLFFTLLIKCQRFEPRGESFHLLWRCSLNISGEVAVISRTLDAAETSKRTGSLLPCWLSALPAVAIQSLSIQQPTHSPPAITPVHHRTDMAKTAVGEFCLKSFFLEETVWLLWEGWKAVATPTAQKRAGDGERPNPSPSLSNDVLIATLLASPA